MGSSAGFSRFLHWLVSSNIFIAIASAAACLSTFIFLESTPDRILLGAVFFATLMIYNSQRLIIDLFYRRRIRAQEIIYGCLGLAGAVPFFFLLLPSQQILLIFAGLISLAYALPFIPSKSGYKALRQIPYLKIWIIVGVWILVSVVSPFLSLNINPSTKYPFLWLIHQGFFIFALTIPFDIRDLKSDAQDQKTIPMIFGQNRAVRIAQGALILCALLSTLMLIQELVSLSFFFSQIVLALLGIIVLAKSKSYQGENYYLLGLDGLIILQGLILIPWMHY